MIYIGILLCIAAFIALVALLIWLMFLNKMNKRLELSCHNSETHNNQDTVTVLRLRKSIVGLTLLSAVLAGAVLVGIGFQVKGDMDRCISRNLNSYDFCTRHEMW